MELPTVSPVGVLELPAAPGVPRRHSRGLRIVAGLLLATFLAVTVVTTVASLGSYCLTSHAGDPLVP